MERAYRIYRLWRSDSVCSGKRLKIKEPELPQVRLQGRKQGQL